MNSTIYKPHMIYNLLAKNRFILFIFKMLYYNIGLLNVHIIFFYINQWSVVVHYWVNTTCELIFIMEWISHFIGLTFSWECDILGLQKGLDRRNKHPIYFSFRMEVKVYVEGVQRIVCGVTGKTTCQEVVIALAQALGK